MTNQLGYDKPLYMLAFDHRGSFQRGLFGIEADPSAGEVERISDAKRLIFEAFELVFGEADDEGSLGLLVDEQFGAEVARRAKRLGAVLAMPVERSGQPEFDFEFGDDFGTHIEAFDPSFAKVLVRYNAEDDAEMNARQAGRLRRLAEWLHEREHKFLFELLVPATDEQLQRVGGDAGRYDLEIRPELVIEAIRELQEAGVEADIWKIEGLDRRGDCERAATQARSGGRDGVACIVLGRGADEAKVLEWLKVGAGVPGYIGFAVGRTLWWNELEAYVGGKLQRGEAAERIAGNYRRMIAAYTS